MAFDVLFRALCSAFWQWLMTSSTLVQSKLYARVQIIVYLKQQLQ